ncbi:CFEM domain-containing protein [Colletotrichum scovillei]|uniref:CFEM domain-containing protein n=1 Tax=Colletotrichum scovillei TaxID=1209932 RepID=A0A9P7QTV1_9PEZI|nr:CFEM domain-containing protein [Colletotrichum scovillei]KAF4780690.1 CFEM domain-containing protein [Colletotrichum scovillei]KAG7039167.1 CFEM domain-containing protein [Colletotrichum scovillei]KAG7041347.1 CFEM domain-containing protein [Colletotrichum scovillei]KAG7061375.1 CFEM domain-containing protein [Colletotrichum scovillei]
MSWTRLRIAVWLACLAVDVIAAATSLQLTTISNATSAGVTSPAPLDPAAAAMEQMAASLSPCALNCTTTEIAKSSCNTTDFACICTNHLLNGNIGACLAQHCTVTESLQAQRYSKTSCRVPVRRNTDQGPITWTLFSIALVALAARLISKIPSLNPAFSFGWDDWLILASTLALIPADIGSQILIGIGLGQDIWMVSPDNITQILLLFFVEELLYSFVVAVTKLSILIFYLRLFAETWFRVVCYIMLGVTTIYGIGQILGIVLVCSPVSYNWTQWDGEHQGKCGNVNVMAFINGGVNIAIDFILFVLPVTQFITVSWTLKKKIGVSLIFLVGLSVTASSGIRLATLAKFGGTQNPTYDYKELSIWSLVEMHMSVICACMPGMTSFIRRVSPRMYRMKQYTPQQPDRNQPRTGRSVARRIQDTLARITTIRITGNRSGWESSQATGKSSGTESSTTSDPRPNAYKDYLVYAPYADGQEGGTELNTLRSREVT